MTNGKHDQLSYAHVDPEYYADDPDGRAGYEEGIRWAEALDLAATVNGTCGPCTYIGAPVCGIFEHCATTTKEI